LIFKSPPFPAVAAPLPISSAPDVPLDDVPELNDIEPLIPEIPESAERIEIEPLDDSRPYPDKMVVDPPEESTPRPLEIVRIPP
jgi:hypothetical protein